MKIRYFDHAATTPVKEEVLNYMLPYFNLKYGNASTMYRLGREARKSLEEARNKVSRVINSKKSEIYFTSCGSESDNLAIKGICYANKNKKHIITSKIEHHAVLDTCLELEKQGYRVTYLDVNSEGIIDLEQLKNSICDDTILISIMYANNEIGTIQPIKEIGEIAHEKNVYFHTDAVQAIGNLKIDVNENNIDLLSMSAHKFYGPKGVGGLYVREGVNFEKIQQGGHQEKNKRAGTENVAGIAGLGKAIEIANREIYLYNDKLSKLRNYYFDRLQEEIKDVYINGDKINRLPGNANVSFRNIDSELLLYKLDEKGICISAGSACNTGENKISHVLQAIGLNNITAKGTLRVTFGDCNTKDDVDYLIDSIKEIVNNE